MQSAPPHAAASEIIEEIVVTGTRIPMQSSQFPTPTTTVDAQVLETAGTVNLGDVLHEYPAMVGGVGGSADAGIVTAGRELLNLRGLGIARTLVLVNGRRQVPGDLGTGAVDVAMIPTPLVERVDIITGGASAIYGADAVTGAVNIILKEDFDGLQLDVLGGLSERGDGERGNLNVIWGKNFADSRGNVVISGSYTEEARIRTSARSFSAPSTGFVLNPANTGPSDGISDRLFTDNSMLRSYSREGILHLVNNAGNPFLPMQELAFDLPLFAGDAIGLGAIPILGAGLQPDQPLFDSFTQDPQTGEVRPFVSGGPCDILFCQGGDGINLQSFGDISVPFERAAASLNGRYEFDALTVRVNGRYGRTQARGTGQATVHHDFNFGPFVRVERDNPFLPRAMAAEMDARGLTAAPLATLAFSLEDENEWESWQLTLIAEGELWDRADFEFYGQYGATHLVSILPDVLLSRYFQALDATSDAAGNAVCRDPSNGCMPYNPFAGEISGAALDFAGVDIRSTAKLTQMVFGVAVNGEAGALPGGSLKYALGAEYRRETSKTIFDELLQAVDPVTGFGAGLVGFTSSGSPERNLFFPPERGDYDVAEAFAEAVLPLLAKQPLIKSLDLSLAARYANYSTVGSDVSYKAGLNWTLNDTVRLRATYSRAVRAPNITELFAPATRLGQFVNDPCDANQLSAGSNPANRQANCAALGLPPDFFSFANNTSRPVTQTGNRDLAEEEAHTVTVGAIVTLGQRFSVAVDYWDIQIDDAITVFSANETLENCVDGAALDPAFCDLVTRSPDGQIANINVTRINAAEFIASGIDFEVRYDHFFDHGGSLSVSTIATYTEELTFFQSADDPDSKNEIAGAIRRPRFRGLLRTSYAVGKWQVGWDVNYVGKTKISNSLQPEELPFNRIGDEMYHDVNFGFSARDNIQLYAGVNNLTDNKPPLFLNAGSTLYDGVGRYFFAGVRIDLR